jgi:hypothetical protein
MTSKKEMERVVVCHFRMPKLITLRCCELRYDGILILSKVESLYGEKCSPFSNHNECQY